jgi:dihydroorotate dehydrogenase
VIDLAIEIGLDGIVATNTTLDRGNLHNINAKEIENIGAGGLSGSPLKTKSTSVVAAIHARTKSGLPIVASGGIFNAQDAREKVMAGAALLQVWTGFIYEGPGIVKKILQGNVHP